MPSKPSAAKPPEQTFESAIERLEHIVEEMESDRMPLEQLLERYEEGIKLVKTCQEKLEAAEKRIEIITRNASGKPQLNVFEAGPTAMPAPSPAPVAKPSRSESDSDDVSLF
jgi:exodeoxyribonuclease VII small subunit